MATYLLKTLSLLSMLFIAQQSFPQSSGEITAQLYADGSLVKIVYKNGIITEVSPQKTGNSNIDVFVAPGFIDTQMNGYANVSFSQPDLDEAGIDKITKNLWKEGVTTYFPTFVTGARDMYLKNLKLLGKYIDNHPNGSCTPGAFLEGPYISPIDGFRGAHSLEHVRNPDWKEFESFIAASGNHIILIGLAPELPGAIDFIKKTIEKDIFVSLAHHNGTSSLISDAVEAGAIISTHLGNGCANMIHRHNNPIWPQLSEDRLTPAIIVDGHHLLPEEVNTFYKVKGPENLMLVSDAVRLAGMPPGEYTWGDMQVVMTEEGKLRLPSQDVLAGASFPINTGISNVMKFTGCSLKEAVNMATKVPARVFELTDRGVLEKGKRADMVLFKQENGKIVIHQTIVMGKTVYSKK
ncbi:MAG: N-acetylglucosamine-6-phosphate deacetylase [Cyclobacteriaceae bacterium]|nr:N-acetylglucosamine-6-phosphate deacetylase [Cyclobacteriaceae bacterium]